MSDLYITREGERKLHEELKHLKEVKRPIIIQAIANARRMGDLAENAEYHAAKEEQFIVESRIHHLEVTIRNAKILDNLHISEEKAYIGAQVEVEDLDTGVSLSYILVNEVEADFSKRKISTISPIGKGLLGKAVGEIVEITIPKGVLRYKIIKISR
jgi:transcription elongation factor GreA